MWSSNSSETALALPVPPRCDPVEADYFWHLSEFVQMLLLDDMWSVRYMPMKADYRLGLRRVRECRCRLSRGERNQSCRGLAVTLKDRICLQLSFTNLTALRSPS